MIRLLPKLSTLTNRLVFRTNSSFHTSHNLSIKAHELPPRPKFTPDLESEIEESFLHGGRGPGGQKINKCNSKVQLKHVPSGIVVNCQETRSRDKNRKIAREKLAMEIAVWKNGGQMVDRQLKMIELKQQRKLSKLKKSTKKHELVKQQKEEQKLKQEQEDREFLAKMMQ
ncbi:hypothetical protein ACO0QE_003472 [Hanseniaspora vineae]